KRRAHQCARQPDELPALCGPYLAVDPYARRSDPGARRVVPSPGMAVALCAGSTLCVRTLSESERRGGRFAEMDRGRAGHRRRRPCAVVQRRLQAYHAGGGLACDAGRLALVPPAAVQLLRREPCDGRRALSLRDRGTRRTRFADAVWR